MNRMTSLVRPGLGALAVAQSDLGVGKALTGPVSASMAVAANADVFKPLGAPLLVLATVNGRVVSTYLTGAEDFASTGVTAAPSLVTAELAGSRVSAEVSVLGITAEVTEVQYGLTAEPSRIYAEVAPSAVSVAVEVSYIDYRKAA